MPNQSSRSGHGELVMRNSVWWAAAGFFGLIAVAGVFSAAGDIAGGGDIHWRTYPLFLGVPVFVLLAVRSCRSGVRVDHWGVEVVSEVSTRRIAWSDVETFELAGLHRWNTWLIARRPDGAAYMLATGSIAVRPDKLTELRDRLTAA